jgi:hypothetical protein
MSIKIFGDSFVVDDKAESWPLYLSQLLNEPVTTYGIGGSSLFSAYQLMCKHASRNDRVMLYVTNPGRLYFDEKSEVQINCKNTAELILADNSYSTDAIEKAKAAALYYDHLANPVFDEWVHSVILDDIKRLFPDVIFLNKPRDILVETSTRELALLGIDHYFFLDKRVNHISKTNSLYVAECIHNYCKHGTFDFDINQIKRPTDDESQLFKFL